MPELRQLQIFAAVAEELNFTRAARRLHLGQQAVSKAVHQLERELGVTLLERTTHEVRLTPAGAALRDDGRQALAAVDAAFDRARQVGLGLAGTVTIGVTPAIAPAERDRVVRVLRDGAQRLRVSIRDIRPGDIRDELRARAVDLVLARIGVDGVASATLSSTPAVLCVPTGHPLATARSVPASRLDGLRLLTWQPPGTPFTDLLKARLAAVGAAVTPVQSRVTGAVLASELTDVDAVALLPTGWPPSHGISLVPLQDRLTFPLLMLWHPDATSPWVERIRAHSQRRHGADAATTGLIAGRA
ncbi:LysR family transcriptional regulator [Pseudonocardia acaciae]|uniref:LysR family transcriptional regulator n=1 Tax=Pseudonocardia acaciae TaxID=551276 RepID=UPI0006888808|nr:LysR family transcriptional regulator [Pseudonocardia acaciae]